MHEPEHYLNAGLAAYSKRLQRLEFTVEEATLACLRRIDQRDSTLQAFVHVAYDSAVKAARELDALLLAGKNLGPLMGAPVAIKDLYTVTGMPIAAGSRVDVSDLIEPEGDFVGLLRKAGCIILGKTRTTEFALGGVNLTHPTPWNPCDAEVHRTPGGSSSGSAVALAAGVCGFSIGSDTGGSVRQPAAVCGLVGYKASNRAWPSDGIFALSPTLDSIGWFAVCASDAATVYASLRGESAVQARQIRGMRLGRPVAPYFDDLEPTIERRMDEAVEVLAVAGAEIWEVELPERQELDDFVPIVPIELIARLGRSRIEKSKDLLDPVALARLVGVKIDAADYLALIARQKSLCRRIASQMAGVDAWIMPTTLDIATPVSELRNLEAAKAWNGRAFRTTRLANLFGQCAVSLPLPGRDSDLPSGLQIACPHGDDRRLLAISMGIEKALRGDA